VLLLLVAVQIPALSQSGKSPLLGRWDLTISSPESTYPSWLEVTEKDGNLQGRAQPREGGVVPATVAPMGGSRFLVTVSNEAPFRPPAADRPAPRPEPEVTWELEAKGGKLSGIQKRGDRAQGQVTGVQAPLLKRAAPPAWTSPEPLFNGKDLTGWTTINNTQGRNAEVNRWVVKDGALVNEARGPNILTTRKFDDFKLHLEFNLEARANSGVYLRGRYEIQMPPPGTPRPDLAAQGGGARGGMEGRGLGYAIHGFVPAIAPAPGNPGEWRTCDVTLVGRNVTVAINGVTIVDNQEIPGITGGALDSNEAEPGPILFQGDHAGGVMYRNITISVPKR
jgi:hypothetical protein